MNMLKQFRDILIGYPNLQNFPSDHTSRLADLHYIEFKSIQNLLAGRRGQLDHYAPKHLPLQNRWVTVMILTNNYSMVTRQRDK